MATCVGRQDTYLEMFAMHIHSYIWYIYVTYTYISSFYVIYQSITYQSSFCHLYISINHKCIYPLIYLIIYQL